MNLLKFVFKLLNFIDNSFTLIKLDKMVLVRSHFTFSILKKLCLKLATVMFISISYFPSFIFKLFYYFLFSVF